MNLIIKAFNIVIIIIIIIIIIINYYYFWQLLHAITSISSSLYKVNFNSNNSFANWQENDFLLSPELENIGFFFLCLCSWFWASWVNLLHPSFLLSVKNTNCLLKTTKVNELFIISLYTVQLYDLWCGFLSEFLLLRYLSFEMWRVHVHVSPSFKTPEVIMLLLLFLALKGTSIVFILFSSMWKAAIPTYTFWVDRRACYNWQTGSSLNNMPWCHKDFQV